MVGMTGAEGTVGGCCGLREGSGDDGGGGAAATCQRRAEIRRGRGAFGSCCELPNSGGGRRGEVFVAIFIEIP